MDLSLDVWTPSSYSTDNTLSIWQRAMPSYLMCVLSYPLSDMASSHCLAVDTLLPPRWWALSYCIHDITPFLSHWDSAWHADNAHFLAPNIGGSRIREPTSVFSLTSRTPYSADQFVWHLSNSTAWIEVEYLPLWDEEGCCGLHLHPKQHWMTVLSIYVDWNRYCSDSPRFGKGYAFITVFLHYTLQQGSHFPVINSLGIRCESQTITSGCKKKGRNILFSLGYTLTPTHMDSYWNCQLVC